MVFAATYGSERVCVKQVFVTVMDPLAVGDFRREVKMLAQLRHPHIVHLFGICELQNKGLAIVMEMCGGSLQDLIQPPGSTTQMDRGAATAAATGAAVVGRGGSGVRNEGGKRGSYTRGGYTPPSPAGDTTSSTAGPPATEDLQDAWGISARRVNGTAAVYSRI